MWKQQEGSEELLSGTQLLEHVLLSSAGQALPKDSITSEELLPQSGTDLVCIHGTSVSTIC